MVGKDGVKADDGKARHSKRTPSDAIRKHLLESVAKHSHDLVSFTSAHFRISAPAVHRHLKKLIAEGLIQKEGVTRHTRYFATQRRSSWHFDLNQVSGEEEVWETKLAPILSRELSNIQDIFQYSFTEMFNNVLDHSQAQSARLTLERKKEHIQITISDDGVGVFHKIKEHFSLNDFRESVLALSKGKTTTDPQRHSGEGIFFASRVVDIFQVKANGLVFCRSELEDEWYLQSEKSGKEMIGTEVTLIIDRKSQRRTEEVFRRFSDPQTLQFEKTEVPAKLCQLEAKRYISRSEAKRLLTGLSEFKHIVFDFRRVEAVGQGFVDEVFRVFANKHPEIVLTHRNANEDVEFMIKRGLQV